MIRLQPRINLSEIKEERDREQTRFVCQMTEVINDTKRVYEGLREPGHKVLRKKLRRGMLS